MWTMCLLRNVFILATVCKNLRGLPLLIVERNKINNKHTRRGAEIRAEIERSKLYCMSITLITLCGDNDDLQRKPSDPLLSITNANGRDQITDFDRLPRPRVLPVS